MHAFLVYYSGVSLCPVIFLYNQWVAHSEMAVILNLPIYDVESCFIYKKIQAK